MKVNFNKKKLLFSITTILLIIFFISEVFSHIHKKSSNNSNNAKNQKSKSYSNKTSSNSKLNKTNSHNHNYNNIHRKKFFEKINIFFKIKKFFPLIILKINLYDVKKFNFNFFEIKFSSKK